MLTIVECRAPRRNWSVGQCLSRTTRQAHAVVATAVRESRITLQERRTALFHQSRVERRGQITLAERGQDGDDELALVFVALADLERRPHRGTRGDADEEALLPREAPRGVESRVVRHTHDFVVE